jgi:hypothetical protein
VFDPRGERNTFSYNRVVGSVLVLEKAVVPRDSRGAPGPREGEIVSGHRGVGDVDRRDLMLHRPDLLHEQVQLFLKHVDTL